LGGEALKKCLFSKWAAGEISLRTCGLHNNNNTISTRRSASRFVVGDNIVSYDVFIFPVDEFLSISTTTPKGIGARRGHIIYYKSQAVIRYYNNALLYEPRSSQFTFAVRSVITPRPATHRYPAARRWLTEVCAYGTEERTHTERSRACAECVPLAFDKTESTLPLSVPLIHFADVSKKSHIIFHIVPEGGREILIVK